MGQSDYSWISDGINVTIPSAARMYDYFLGGHHHFEVDRHAAEKVLQFAPLTREITRANRAFLHRVVRFMLSQGINQFLDIGSGIPTVGNVHEIAQEHNSDARVVYVDIDPVAIEHSRLLLEGNDNVCAIQADARCPDTIISHPEVERLIDFTREIGLLFVGMLYFITDDEEAYSVTQDFYQELPDGSLVAISHFTDDNARPEIDNVLQLYRRSTNPARIRPREQISVFFDSLELIEPGLVWLPQWRPEGEHEPLYDRPLASMGYAGVGRKL